MKILHSTLKLVLTVSLLAMTVVIFAPRTASALSGSEFDPARIIDDAVFYNKTVMSVNQIQLFLNSKLPVCDTWGTKSYSGSTTRAAYASSQGVSTPFTCLKDYSQTVPTVINSGSDLCGGSIAAGTKSSAQIIYEVSQACGVSPQVLLVLLQKEQSLVTDDWPWPIQYRSATGYGCPDTAPCDAEFYGFFNQVYQAAKGYKRYRANPANYNYRAGRNNTVYYHPGPCQTWSGNTCTKYFGNAYKVNGIIRYGGQYAGQGPSAPDITYCGGTNLYIHNQATAGLYIYTPYQPNASALHHLYGTGDTCSSYGNRNFWRMFSDWFGSTKAAATNCNSKIANVTCVWSVIKSDGSQFLTSSKSERDATINNYGWVYEGIAFYAPQTQKPGTVPVYRLRIEGRHYYTAVQSERNILIATPGWVDEGIAFYAYPTTVSDSMSHQVYKLHNSAKDQYYWTYDNSQKQLLVNSGYDLLPTTFRGFSGMADLPVINSGRDNIYRLQGNGRYFYTTNLYELESVINGGFYYEGVLTTANETNTGTPVYRLQNAKGHFYTANAVERNKAISTYGMSDEGVGFYLDNTSSQVYRVANAVTGKYLYTSSLNEVFFINNTNGWIFEGMLFSKPVAPSPIYRFLNLFNNRHFYTISLSEGMRITNRGWQYETVAFTANTTSSGFPVYRLLLNDKHFYTTNPHERDIAINTFGYVYEGVAFYVSPTATAKPVYRLQGGSGNEYFYTAHGPEKDVAVNKFGYRYEGIVFYLP